MNTLRVGTGRAGRPARSLHRIGVTFGVATVVMLVGGVAWAAWTSTGTGSGSAKASTFQAVTVAPGTAPAGQLYPGLTADGSTVGGDLVVSATNPNPFPVTVTVTGGAASGCGTTGVSLFGTPSFTLPASSGTVSRTMTKVVSMSAASTSDCQNATITIALTTSAVSS